jgi:hypothetical protein
MSHVDREGAVQEDTMRRFGDIIVANARASGKDAYAFTVYVIVDPAVVRQSQGHGDHRTPQDVVADEIESNLDSVPYVDHVVIRRRPI